jgi:hypothetical protein
MLEQYLRIYCNYEQDNWSKLLPLAEFAYNNTPHSSTGVSPFFTTHGYDPLIAVHPDAEVTDLHTKHFTINFNEVHQFLHDQMKDTQDTMSQFANQQCMAPPPFHIGDHVYIHTNHIHTNRTACKLAEKKISPFCNEYHILPSPTQSLRCTLASSDTSDASATLPLQQTPHPHKPETTPMHPLCPEAPHCPTRSLTVSEATHYLQTSHPPARPLATHSGFTLD